MSAINVPGRARLHRARSTTLLPTGRKSTSTITSGKQAASFKLTATKATASFMSQERTAQAASGKRPVGRIGDVTSMISGPRTNPRSRERLSTVSVRFTTSSATLQASPSMSALLLVRSTAKQRSKHSASGLKRNWPVFRARAIWLKLSDMA